jgi:Nif-specific regulatory protein
MVQRGEYRADLYYRHQRGASIVLPPLRERIGETCRRSPNTSSLDRPGGMQRRRAAAFTSERARDGSSQHHWPGNVRELENCLERAAVMSESGEIDADLIRIDRSRDRPPQRPGGTPTNALPAAPGPLAGDGIEPGGEQSERERVIAALEQAGWVQARAARLLGMTPRQIAYRVQILNIEVKQM